MIAVAPAHISELKNYTSWFEKLNVPYTLLNSGDTMENFSMLILCGGADLGKIGNERRDTNEINWFREAYGKIHVLGICRGMQLANKYLGGTLFEDISNDPIRHSSNRKEISGENVSLLESSYHDIIFNDGKRIKVNSRHHQGLRDVAEGLKITAICEEDKMIEMVEGEKSLFVQWHPEREEIWGTEAEKIVSDWIKARVDISEQIDPMKRSFDKIVHYLRSKDFTVVSREIIMNKIDIGSTNVTIDNLVKNFPLKNVTDKKGRPAIKLITK